MRTPKEDDMAGSAFGLGSPFMSTPMTSGLSPYGTLGQGINPIGISSLQGSYLPQQTHQLLHQQLQQIQQLQYVQQQQLQQLIQFVPAQLVQLQQLIQIVAQQLQQIQQPLGQGAGAGYAVTPWGITPQAFGAQSGQVM
jgi:hypothetical protein